MTMYLPANNNSLFDSWQNGSLSGQINTSLVRVYESNWLPHNPQLNLTILPNNLATLGFNSSDPNLGYAFPLAEAIFDPEAFRFLVICMWPVSGQYDVLSRILFYVMMVVSLLFRHYRLVSLAAMGTAMTYAAVTAVHTLALIANTYPSKPWPGEVAPRTTYFDPDLCAIFPILAVAGIMLNPILMWSTTVRKFKPVVVVYWGLLVFIALAVLEKETYFNDDLPNMVGSFAVCTSRSPYCLSDAKNQDSNMGMTTRYYNTCDCMDFCGTLSPASPMRRNTNMVAWTQNEFVTKAVLSTAFNNLSIFSLVACILVVLTGALAILESQITPEETRNMIFATLNGDKGYWIRKVFEGDERERLLDEWNTVYHARVKKWSFRQHIARLVAAFFFLISIFWAVVSPALFVIAVIGFELELIDIPASEQSDAVGAWGTWVAAGFILVATMVDKYHHAWVQYILEIMATAGIWARYTKPEESPLDQSSKTSKKGKSELRMMTVNFFLIVASPFKHFWCSIKREAWKAKWTLKIFARWWVDPAEMSRLDRRRKMFGSYLDLGEGLEAPKCTCQICIMNRKEEEEGPLKAPPRAQPGTIAMKNRLRNWILHDWPKRGVPTRRNSSNTLLDTPQSPSIGSKTATQMSMSTESHSLLTDDEATPVLPPLDPTLRTFEPFAAILPAHPPTVSRRDTDQSLP